MAFQPRDTAADISYPFEYDPTANEAGRTRMELCYRPTDYRWLEADRGQLFPHHGYIHGIEDLRRLSSELAALARARHPHPPYRYDGHDFIDSGRRERLYQSPPPDYSTDEWWPGERGRHLSRDPTDEWWPGQHGRHLSRHPLISDAADAELEFDRRRRHANRGPLLQHAFDNESSFDGERHGHLHRHRFDTDRRPFHPRDLASRDFDEESFNDMSLRGRTPLPGPEFRRSHGVGPDHFDSLGQRMNMDTEPRLDDYDEDFGTALRGGHRDLGGSDGIDPRFWEHFRDHTHDDIPSREGHARWHPGHLRTGHRSDFDLRSPYDDIDQERTAAADFNHRRFLAQRHSEFDTEDEQHARLERQYTAPDPRIANLEYERQFNRNHNPHATEPHPAANLRGRHLPAPPISHHDGAFKLSQPPHQPISRPTNSHTIAGYGLPRHPHYDFQGPAAQAAANPWTVRAEETGWPLTTAATMADTTEDAASWIPQERIAQLQYRTFAPDSAESSRNHVAIPRGIPSNIAPVSRSKSVEDEGSDGGYNIPDHDSAISDGIRAEESGASEVLRSFINIEL